LLPKDFTLAEAFRPSIEAARVTASGDGGILSRFPRTPLKTLAHHPKAGNRCDVSL